MNSLLTKIIILLVLRDKNQTHSEKKQYSRYEVARGYKVLISNAKRFVKDILLIIIGIFSASFGFKGFLLTNHFIDGGFTFVARNQN